MFDDLALTLNAQFYRAKAEFTEADLTSVLNAATENAFARSTIANDLRVNVERGESSYAYSLRVFKARRAVYFLPGHELEDQIYAFILILEIDGYLVVLRKGCANFSDSIERIGVPVPPTELWRTFDDDEVAFQKLSVRNMTVSDKAVRARSFEAADLRGLLSTHAAGRSIPYFLRVRNGRQISSLSLSTSRLFDASDRVPAATVADWARNKIRRLRAPNVGKSFLSAFAKGVDLNDVLDRALAASILVEGGRLAQMVGEAGGLLYTVENGIKRELPGELADRVYHGLGRVFEVDPDLNVIGVKAKLRRNKRTLGLVSQMLQRIHVDVGGDVSTLQSFIVKNNLFCVCFTDPKYMYFMGQCFEDVSGVSQIDSLLDMLHPKAELSGATSEKGVEPVAAHKTRFDASSMFDIVERLHAGDEFLFCDDKGGIEWADHIALDKASGVITFIHSKHGDETTSASKLHDVVGQGIKNLGNMFFSLDQFVEVYDRKLGGLYEASRIRRKRRGREADLRSALRSMLANYGVQRRCVLACDFISRARVEAEFGRLKSGLAVRGHIVQLLWILSSFSHAAREVGVEPRIYCKP